MKKKKIALDKKLFLGKSSIATLSDSDQTRIVGGTYPNETPSVCVCIETTPPICISVGATLPCGVLNCHETGR